MNFFRKIKPEIVELPKFNEMIFIDADSKRWRYRPQKDITPYEVALLLPTFLYTPYPFDRFPYIKEHGLMKHFEEE